MRTLSIAAGYLLLVAIPLAATVLAVHLHRRQPHLDPATCPHATVDDGGVCLDCDTDVEAAERVATLVPAIVRKLP